MDPSGNSHQHSFHNRVLLREGRRSLASSCPRRPPGDEDGSGSASGRSRGCAGIRKEQNILLSKAKAKKMKDYQ